MDQKVQPSALSLETPKIVVNDMNFYYGKFHALKNINLRLWQIYAATHIQPYV
jgi:ABC-type phosphate transport system ATPase subunit